MTVTESMQLRITDDDLRKYYIIVFSPEANSRFFDEFLSRLSRRQRDELMGYGTGTAGNAKDAIKRGRYPAWRFKIMYKNSDGKMDPNRIRLDFDNSVLCRYGSSWIPIDENSKSTVWDAICDGI